MQDQPAGAPSGSDLVAAGTCRDTTREGGVVDVPPSDPSMPAGSSRPSRGLTRRQVLGGLAAVGIAGVGAAVVGLDRVLNPSSTPSAAPPTVASGSATQPRSPSPSAGSSA